MRTTFIITDHQELVSALRSRVEPHQLSVGAAIVMATAYETPFGIIPVGAKGFIIYVDQESGNVEVLMEGAEPAIYPWKNKLVLSPFTCEDLVVCTKLSVDNKPPLKQIVPIGGTLGATSLCHH